MTLTLKTTVLLVGVTMSLCVEAHKTHAILIDIACNGVQENKDTRGKGIVLF
jgi:hypothetical protein